MGKTCSSNWIISSNRDEHKVYFLSIFETDSWSIPQTPNQHFISGIPFILGVKGDVLGMLQGYVGFLSDSWNHNLENIVVSSAPMLLFTSAVTNGQWKKETHVWILRHEYLRLTYFSGTN